MFVAVSGFGWIRPHVTPSRVRAGDLLFLLYQVSPFWIGVLNQLVNVNCVFLISDGDVKRHKVYTGSGNRRPTFSLRDRSCILYTEVLVVGGYKLSERES